MTPVQCPSCQLKWNIREDSPSVVTCPMCLAPVNHPGPEPPPLPELLARPAPRWVKPVEYETAADTNATRIAVWLTLGIVGVGTVVALLTHYPVKQQSALAIVLIAGFIIVVVMILLGAYTGERTVVGVGLGVLVSGCFAMLLIGASLFLMLLFICGARFGP